MRKLNWMMGLAGAALFATGANAAFVVEIDTDGLDDGVLTFSPNFSFGGDTTSASQSIATDFLFPGQIPGLTGGDSIFGGNGVVEADTYVFTYTPGVDADNLALVGGEKLGDAQAASGIAGGATDVYRIYAAWPDTANVSGGPTQWTLNGSDGSSVVLNTIDQNTVEGSQWIFLGERLLTAGVTYDVLQQPTTGNTFVSQRAGGVLFEIPEPGTFALLGLGGLATLARRRTA